MDFLRALTALGAAAFFAFSAIDGGPVPLPYAIIGALGWALLLKQWLPPVAQEGGDGNGNA